MFRAVSRYTTTVRAALVCAVAVWLTDCGGRSRQHVDRQDADAEHVPVSIVSSKTGAVYSLGIYVPPSYAAGSARYPVIYIIDGDAAFPPDGRFANFKKILQRRHIEAILVGIGGTKRRDADFVLPGARAYHDFITQELVPFIDLQFRTDPSRRILSGISLGGSFVVTALFLEAEKKPVFSHYLSAEGSFFQPTFLALEQQFSNAMGDRPVPATLILARGAPNVAQEITYLDAGKNSAPIGANLAHDYSRRGTNSAEVDALYQRMSQRRFTDLVVIETHFQTDHIGTDIPSFDDALSRIFDPTTKADNQ